MRRVGEEWEIRWEKRFTCGTEFLPLNVSLQRGPCGAFDRQYCSLAAK